MNQLREEQKRRTIELDEKARKSTENYRDELQRKRHVDLLKNNETSAEKIRKKNVSL